MISTGKFVGSLASAASILAMASAVTPAKADGVQSGGTIIGVFSNVVTQGYIIHSPALTSPPFYENNNSTAVYSIVNSSDTTLTGSGVQTTGSKLQWGASSTVAPEDSFSELVFFGGQVPANIHDPFAAGVITYLNGTSDGGTQIFGADLSFYVNTVSPLSYLGTDKITITTTSNLNASLSQDADYINICGNGSNICGSSIEAYEDSEGGTGVTADLTAQIVGDPTLVLTGVALASGQNPMTSGLIGSEYPLGAAAPEAPVWAMMLLGLAGLGAVARFRKGADAARA